MAKNYINNYGNNYSHNNRNNNERGQYDNSSQKLGDFYNPYGFVPLSKKVFRIDDQEKKILQYCHDVPFKGGMSGYFDVTFEAVTPLCVGMRRETETFSYKKEDGSFENREKEVYKCPKIGNDFYVPGSSIKGMVENVFRIITFGNISNYIDNNRYSVRELKADSIDYDLHKEGTESGFLVKLRHNYYILPCRSTKKTFHEIETETHKTGFANILEERRRTIRDKYNFLQEKYAYVLDNKYFMWLISGHMDGKKHEHLFEIDRDEIVDESLLLIDNTSENNTWDDFIFIHEQENANKSWEFWKGRLKNFKSLNELKSINVITKEKTLGIIPVFYREENGRIKDLGFSRLYRQPYRYNIYDCLPEQHKESCIDLAQAVFGYSNNNESLKGRVRFSHAICRETKELDPVFITAGSPKASFYPFYLKQNKENSYKTYGSPDATINGWKRFLISDPKPSEERNMNTFSVQSVFKPLKAGTKFTCRISYHNLRPFELGALINAVDFFEEEACQLIGYAKPFGYGRIKVVEMTVSEEQNDTRVIYEQELEKRTGIGVIDADNMFTEVFSRLLFFTSDEYMNKKKNRYPYLGNKRENIPNEFNLIKKENKNIRDFNPK